MNNILEVWKEVEKANEHGLIKRLYKDISDVHFYAIFQNPEKHFGLALSYNENIDIDITSFMDLKDVNVSIQDDSSFKNRRLLVIKLVQYDSLDIFATICENMLQTVASLQSSEVVVKTVINQLKKWENLFDRLRGEGLSIQEQQGLFGELHFLQKYIELEKSTAILNYWCGVDRDIRDFQYSNWAVEVKTTSGNNHQKITISSERQLDESLIPQLYLYHLSVEASKGNGESLNDKIDYIRRLIISDSYATSVFNNKLLEIGYFERHIHLYSERCYKIRAESFFQIESDFPRIKENELRNGVGDVKYSVIVSQCSDYLVSESSVIQTISNSWTNL